MGGIGVDEGQRPERRVAAHERNHQRPAAERRRTQQGHVALDDRFAGGQHFGQPDGAGDTVEAAVFADEIDARPADDRAGQHLADRGTVVWRSSEAESRLPAAARKAARSRVRRSSER